MARPQRTLKYYASGGQYIGAEEYAYARQQQHAREVIARRMESQSGQGQMASRQRRSSSDAPRTARTSSSNVRRMSFDAPDPSDASNRMTSKLTRQHEEIMRQRIRFADDPADESVDFDD